MLTIREGQLDVFTARACEEFAQLVLERAQAAGVTQRPSCLEARERIAAGIEAALGLGFLSPPQAERLAVLSLRHGAGFETRPWAHAILWDGRATIDERLDRLEAAPIPVP